MCSERVSHVLSAADARRKHASGHVVLSQGSIRAARSALKRAAPYQERPAAGRGASPPREIRPSVR